MTKLNKRISELFIKTRGDHNLTQVQFSRMLKMTQGNLSKIERGDFLPNLECWMRFCYKFNYNKKVARFV